jgi:hypothetical protein
MSAFELNSLAVKESVEVQLRHPVSDELLWADEAKSQPVQAILWSTSSKPYRNAITEMQNRQLKRGKKQASAEVMREESIKLLTACTQRFDNIQLDGVALDNEDAIRAMYINEKYSWVKSQVDEALGDIGNFIKA